MNMSAPTGSAVLTSTDERPPPAAEAPAAQERPGSAYLHSLALRRQAEAIRRQSAYGLVMGWILTLVAGFIYYCVPSRLDWLWAVLIGVGLLHLAAAVVLPQALAWPERVWMAVARWQGWLVMLILLTVVYFVLLWPAGRLRRRREEGFIAWEDQPPAATFGWRPIDLAETDSGPATQARRRGLPLLLVRVIAFFFRRGNYVLLPILILLLVLGLILYFVQSSALAPFIYTLF
jgi:hypothetical protein